MTMEYEDAVRSITQKYWQTLLSNDTVAREVAAELAQRYGFHANAADTMIEEFSRQPLQEWLAQQSGNQEPVVIAEEFSHQAYGVLVQQSGV